MNTGVKKTDKVKNELENIRRYFECLPHKVFVKDSNHVYIFCNKNYADDLKIIPEKIRGKDDYEFYSKEDADKYRADDRRILEAGQPESIIEHYTIAGEVQIINTFKVPIKDENGNSIAILGFFSDITSFKKAEEDARRKNAVLNAINRIFKEALTCETEKTLASTCLSIAEELTGSKFGFLGEINHNGKFDTIALSDPGWDNCTMSKSDSSLLLSNMEIGGIWGKVIKENTSLIINDPSSHPDSIGIPEGHPEITSFLGIPIRSAGKVTGMIALANKEGGYNQSDLDSIEKLSISINEVLKAKRVEKRIARMAQEILEVSTPVIRIWEGIVIAPLIGMLDSQRTQGFMDRFLNSIVETNSSTALLDITGVPTIDTQTGQYLIEAITSARLLGTEVILTGVSPKIAQTLVHLGIDLAGFHTCSSLASGFKMALDIQQMKVVPAANI